VPLQALSLQGDCEGLCLFASKKDSMDLTAKLGREPFFFADILT
jgi:hypothetical protein